MFDIERHSSNALTPMRHSGVLGMRWGVRKDTVGSLTAKKDKLNKKITKMETKKPKYEKKIVKYDSLASKRLANSMYVQTKMMDKMMGKRIQILGLGKPNLRKAKKYGAQLRKANARYSNAVRLSAKYKKRIYKDKKLAAKFEVKIKDIDAQIVNFGRDAVNGTLKEA